MKIKVGVFFGGQSVEHEVSIISAVQAMNYFDQEKYEVIPVYMTRNNEMYTGEELRSISAYSNMKQLLEKSQRIILVNQEGEIVLERYPHKMFSAPCGTIDVAFPIVHGTNVEDGCFQGYLKTIGVPFVGCDVLSSALGMNKYIMKAVLKEHKLPVVDGEKVYFKEYDEQTDEILKRLEDRFSYPLIVKPINLGSSVGIKKAYDSNSLKEAIEFAFQFANEIVVERVVENLREINCAVIGDNESARASECEEPINTDEILSYSDKYLNGSKSGSKGMASTKRILPANLSKELREKIQELAVKTFQCLGCNGISRIDFLMDSKTEEIWINEINTIPGSLSFYLWNAVGLSYPKLLDEAVGLALKRSRQSKDIVYSIDTNILSGANISGLKTGLSKLNG